METPLTLSKRKDLVRELKRLLTRFRTGRFWDDLWYYLDEEPFLGCKTYTEFIQRKSKLGDEEYVRMNSIISKLGFEETDIVNLLVQTRIDKFDYQDVYSKINNLKETRDNKGQFVDKWATYGGCHNKIRYPSKKRSKRVWKKFYEMFPKQAELDHWNGESSDKMK